MPATAGRAPKAPSAPAKSGGPAVFRPAHVNLGVAVDLEKSDGTRTLMVPVVQRADEADFRGFWKAYEDLVRKVRGGKGEVPDFVGATITITNPGTLGTVQSVPRLMAGQGAIIGVGTIDFPAEWQGADRRQLAELGVSKVVTISSTYDHRVIQGAESGLFLQRVHKLLMGEDGFYEGVFRSMGVPYEPVRYNQDVNDPFEPATNYVEKQQKVERVVNAYRVRGHLIAHLDPLDWKEPQMHAELDPAIYGLTVWDLDRGVPRAGLGGQGPDAPGRDPLAAQGRLLPYGRRRVHAHHGARAKTVDPTSCRGGSTNLEPEEHRHILAKLNAAEALERFLETKYIGQKRFGLEGAESAVPLLGRAARACRRRGAPARGNGHGPPGPPQRTDKHRGQELPGTVRGVRGEPRPDQRPRFGRRQVPQGFQGYFPGSFRK